MSGAATQRGMRAFDAARDERELLARCAALCERARARGADEAEVFGARYESIAVRFEKGDMKLTQVDDGSSLGLRVFHANRLGFASTNRAEPDALDEVARDAGALARMNPPDPANRLPASRTAAPELGLVRREVAELSVERAIELGRELVDRACAFDARLSLDASEFSVRRGSSAIVNSLGIAQAESDAVVSFMLMGMAVDGAEVGGFHYVGDTLRGLDALESSMERQLREFGETVIGNLGAGAAESYRGPVLFSADAFHEVFVDPFVAAASAIAVQRGRSALAGKLGAQVASACFSIEDDPTDASLAGAGHFDREGQPCARYALVRDGVLAGYMYDGYAAAVEGRASTGHALGGTRNLPMIGAHARVVAPGSGGDLAALRASLGRGLYVGRFSGTVDPASGDFSGVAKSSRWIEGGRVVRSVRETLLSGNAFELARRIIALSSHAERLGGAARVPHAIVDGVSVTAG